MLIYGKQENKQERRSSHQKLYGRGKEKPIDKDKEE
jgi:hypothetical protein